MGITKSVIEKNPGTEVADIKWKKKEHLNPIQHFFYFKITYSNENLFWKVFKMAKSPLLNISGNDWQTSCTGIRGSEDHSFRAKFIPATSLVTILLLMNAEYDFIFHILAHTNTSWVSYQLTETNRFLFSLNCLLSNSHLNPIQNFIHGWL